MSNLASNPSARTYEDFSLSIGEYLSDRFGRVSAETVRAMVIGTLDESVEKLPANLDSELFVHADDPVSCVLAGFVGVALSYNTLKAIPRYMQRFPAGLREEEKVDFLRYHTVNYMGEVYTLTERLKGYPIKINRAMRRGGLPKLQPEITRFLATVGKELEVVVEMRDRHVHKGRLREVGLDHMADLAVIATTLDDLEIQRAFKVRLRELRTRQSRFMEACNSKIGMILDRYFGAFYDVGFGREGLLVTPLRDVVMP